MEVDLRASLALAGVDLHGTQDLQSLPGPLGLYFADLLGPFSCLHSPVLRFPFPFHLAAH